jgi:hypothetical protein
MFEPNSCIKADNLDGRVYYHDEHAKKVYVLHRIGDCSWMTRSYPEDKVEKLDEPLDWAVITPFALNDPKPANILRTWKRMNSWFSWLSLSD